MILSFVSRALQADARRDEHAIFLRIFAAMMMLILLANAS
jgi:hypothetical protein